jgi:hypothetical protein
VILLGEVVEVGETGGAVVCLEGEDFGGLADIPLAVVALDFVGGVHDVLGGMGST